MRYLIGIDEAGYAPNLGPLVVAGSLWKVPVLDDSMYKLLDHSVSRQLDDNRITIADSKSIHVSNGTLAPLELNLFPILRMAMPYAACKFSELVTLIPNIDFGLFLSESAQQCLDWGDDEKIPENVLDQLTIEPSVYGRDLELPTAVAAEAIQSRAESFKSNCRRKNVRLMKLLFVPIFPTAFNVLADRMGNKASLLSATSLLLVKELLRATANHDVAIVCDKHGGRNQYAHFVERFLAGKPVDTVWESERSSHYRWTESKRRFDILFNAKGESFMPVALASMLAKYVRELSMMLFNQYWQQQQPDLRPTKGYPTDARRFRADIQHARKRLGIREEQLWRVR
jgi:ribonuclease HII